MREKTTEFYTKRRDSFSRDLLLASKQSRRLAWLRFFVFLLIFAPFVVFGWSLYTGLASLLMVVLFFFLIKKNIQLNLKKKKLTLLKKYAEDELLALDHTFSQFDNGDEFLDTNHFFSYDLDLFGEGSLFQFINRTSTRGGKEKLAGWLIKPSLYKSEIVNKQEAVKELAKIPDWRMKFHAEGKLFEETESLNREMKSWGNVKLDFEQGKVIKPILIIVPLLTILSIIYGAITGVYFFTGMMMPIQLIMAISFSKLVNKYYGFFGRKSELLSKYMQQLQLIENHDFESEYLKKLKLEIIQPISASRVFHRLQKLVKEFEYRQNIIVWFILNSLFLWDIRCVYRIWKWQEQNQTKIPEWLNVIAETDALNSLANFAQNNAGFAYPEIEQDDFVFNAEELGHPLLNPKKRIDNQFEMKDWSKVMIITGANMAGKSTFLRTVGVNFVLGRTGAPVCASKMKFTPVAIYTNMRTTDSLLRDESYFFAELKRIKGVLERLQNGEKIFVILDEMLKGTNSIDKLNGSKELIRKLLNYNSVSLIATHDLKLSEMEKEYPGQITNRCFEIRIENDEVIFDYKLSNGATKTMNATFLMKKMGII